MSDEPNLVKRYDPGTEYLDGDYFGKMYADPDGEWVEFYYYAALLARVKKLERGREAAERLLNHARRLTASQNFTPDGNHLVIHMTADVLIDKILIGAYDGCLRDIRDAALDRLDELAHPSPDYIEPDQERGASDEMV